MITLEQAKKLAHGTILYHIENRNADGTPQRWRVNGQVKRWKRDTDRIRVPLKHGLYQYDYLENDGLGFVCLEEEHARGAWIELYRGSGRPTGITAEDPVYCDNGDIAPGWVHSHDYIPAEEE